MNAKQLHEGIRETNLSYMGLVQKMIRADKAEAVSNLGVSEEMADLVAGLSPAQLLKMSGTNLLLCCFRFDESLLLNMITDHKINRLIPASISGKHPVDAVAA
jgi:flagellar transcriptional activator FlhD